MNYFSWISLLLCMSFMMPPPHCYCQSKAKAEAPSIKKEASPSTYALLKNKTYNMFSLILTYMGLEAYFKRKNAAQKQLSLEQQSPNADPTKK